MTKIYNFRFPQYCPTCLPRKIYPYRKHQLLEQTFEGDEVIAKIQYPSCNHIFEFRRPYKKNETKGGYILVNTAKGCMPEHRFVWETAHGEIPANTVIHHINGIKHDNRLENLVALTRNQHNSGMQLHEPICVTCPCCNNELKILTRGKDKYICIKV